jgi:protein-S-isoprenylcysteine O-methyltransferase Ste14
VSRQLLVLTGAAVIAYALEWARRLRERGRSGEELDPRSRRLVALTQWPTMLLVLMAAAFVPALGLPGGWRGPAFAAGLGLLLAGGALRWWAVAALGPYFTGSVAIQPEHRIVRSGPYRWLRHPAYAGRCALILGLGLGTGNLLGLALAATLPLPALIERIRVEEAALSAALPGEYPAYARTTRCLVPFLW